MALTLAEANRMVQAAVGKGDQLGVKVSIAVCDAGGNLLAFNRMEGASAVSATVAQGKAAASAGFGRASGALAADSPVIQAVIAAMGRRMLPLACKLWDPPDPGRMPCASRSLSPFS